MSDHPTDVTESPQHESYHPDACTDLTTKLQTPDIVHAEQVHMQEVRLPDKIQYDTTVSVGNGRRVVSGSLRNFMTRRA